MYKFPEGLYTDIRIEDVRTTEIIYENLKLLQNRERKEKGAFIRVFDGERWYYSSITNIEDIQKEIDDLANMAAKNNDIHENPVVKRMEINKGEELRYKDICVSNVSKDKKIELIKSYFSPITNNKEIQNSKLIYKDKYTLKRIISSKGTDISFDDQRATVALRYNLLVNGSTKRGIASIYEMNFDKLHGRQSVFEEEIKKDIEFTRSAVPVKPGIYTCILSPATTGVFAHESFGHKSESDFMIGNENLAKEWAIGSKVGSSILNIIDTGDIEGSGYVPYDDEGNKSKKTYLIRNGILEGRLHSAYTAAIMGEDITGNARAKNFEYEPIVRMTSTYIGKGTQTKEELFAGVKEGVYIEDIFHGSGLSTFTIAPSRAYMIRDGKIAEAVKISVITGNVMKTLFEIDGLSNTEEIEKMATGGCGKNEQYPLSVAMGGPYVRVKGINVQ